MARLRMGLAILVALLTTSGAARADVYGYVEDGRVRLLYTNVAPTDKRYKLYKRDNLGKAPQAAALPQRVAGISPLVRSRFSSHVLAAAEETRVEPALIHAVISVESGYNPSARSHAGAVGLMQLMPETAKRYGVTDRLDPAQSIHGGARYLRDLKVMFGNNLQLVLAAYNAGEQAVMKYGRRIPPYRETIAYVPKVMSHYNAYRAPKLVAVAAARGA
ncbi:MAG: lytic transglycosylase domain-containing protein [Candidatus Parcubacteria bacterium]|nr:lytic transglycosylase domain-containing protein [Burkholderiales bacterium]